MSDLPSDSIIDRPSSELNADIVVIGSGPGGAVTSCLLAEAGREVLIIEEGHHWPSDSCQPFSQAEMQQKYRNGGLTVAMGATKIAYVEGRCVGGGSEINSGLYHRTPLELLERWTNEFQVNGLTENEMLPHFEANERELSVSTMPVPPPATSLKLHTGATSLGWKSLEVPRWFRYHAIETEAGCQVQSERQTMSKTFIPRALRGGAKLLPNTKVVKVTRVGGHWTLRAVQRHGEDRRQLAIRANTLFVACGAIQTPALLRRSGFTHNIGKSLQLHPTVKVVARFPDEVNARDVGVPVHQVKEFAPDISFGCSISSPPHLALALYENPKEVCQLPSQWRRMGVYYAMIVGSGRGAVRTLPFFRDPLVKYRLTDEDYRLLADGLRRLCELLLAAGAEVIFPSVGGIEAITKTSQLSAIPRALSKRAVSLMSIHLFSSCPMGERLATCATDSFGRVHGVSDLHIADASLLCTAPGVNPQGSIMAVCRRNALNFLREL